MSSDFARGCHGVHSFSAEALAIEDADETVTTQGMVKLARETGIPEME